MSSLSVRTPACQKRPSDPSIYVCKPCGCWEFNSGLLKEQTVILTMEPSFWPYLLFFRACSRWLLSLLANIKCKAVLLSTDSCFPVIQIVHHIFINTQPYRSSSDIVERCSGTHHADCFHYIANPQKGSERVFSLT